MFLLVCLVCVMLLFSLMWELLGFGGAFVVVWCYYVLDWKVVNSVGNALFDYLYVDLLF